MNEKCCYECCWFRHEGIDGYGVCYCKEGISTTYCGDDICDKFVDKEDMSSACELLEKSHINNDAVRSAARMMCRFFRVMNKL